MSGRIPARCARLLAATFATIGALAITAGAASAASVVYNNIPSAVPGDLVSQAFEATSTSEFGGQVKFAGVRRHDATATIALSSYACQSGGGATCKTNGNANFMWPITLKVYEVGPSNTVGARIGSFTHLLKIPYRPSASGGCPETSEGKGWGAGCYLGKLKTFKFKLTGLKLPETAIVAVAYNTQTYGEHPTGTPGPYNSLNVSVSSSYAYNEVTKTWEFTSLPVTVGEDPIPADAYLSSTWGGAYCDGGAGGTGSLRLDSGCWTGFQPELNVKAMKR
jgi:hypothetical protein